MQGVILTAQPRFIYVVGIREVLFELMLHSTGLLASHGRRLGTE